MYSSLRMTSPGQPVRRVGTVVAPFLLVAGLGACTADEASPAPRETAPNGVVFNAADASFAKELLLQRAEEFVLIDLTVGRKLSAPVSDVVDRAREARALQVDTVTTWLTDWGKEVPTTIRDHSSGHGESHHFPELEEASDATFEALWVEAFLAELEASDDLAATQQADGLNPDAVALAEEVDAGNDDEADALEAAID